MRSPRTSLLSMFAVWLILSTACDTQRLASVEEVPVASITVTPPQMSLTVGERVAVLAVVLGTNGNSLSDRSVTWSSSNAAIATVAQTGETSGELLGVAPGTTSITATSEGKSSSISVTVTPQPAVPVDTIVIAPSSASVDAGQTVQLTAVAKDASSNILTGRAISWSSSNTSIATVSASGLVTGVATGVTGITAASEGQQTTATITVMTPPPTPVASVEVAPATATVVVGQTVPLTATPKSATGTPLTGRTIAWTSSNTAVATVSSSGLVTGVAAGAVTITATSEGKSGAAAVTVTAAPPVPVATVTVTPSTANVVAGQTVQLAATLNDANGNPLTGRVVTWASSNTAVATVSSTGLVTGVSAGSVTITAASEGRSGTATVTVTATVTNPGAVTNLAVASVTANAITLSFTEVTNGAGAPASYDVRYAVAPLSWGAATQVAQGTCAVPLAGSAIGATRTCTVQGLAASTAYQFQLVAFRGTLNLNAVFGALSNVASGTTAASTAPVATVAVSPASASVGVGGTQPFTATLRDASGTTLTGRVVTWISSTTAVATVASNGLVTAVAAGTTTITATSEGKSGTATLTVTTAPSGGVVFQSDWSTGTGNSSSAINDGGRWDNYWEFDQGTGLQLMSVVAGGPGGRNALKVVQRGSGPAANLQQDNVVPPSTDFYVRFYMRNDDTSPPGDHIVTVDTWEYANLTFMRKYSSTTGWRFVASLYGCGYTYPIGHWGPSLVLQRGAWYRFEYFVDYIDATHVQLHARVYDASGALILTDADFRQENWGSSSWNGRNDWTLASYNAAGHSFCVNPVPMRHFGLGNNGQAGSLDTGLAWYFAGVQIRTDRWPGP